jgi:thioredoxin reductase (NADPH)
MQANAQREGALVVCLCAAWCDTCAEFRDTFERLERAHPEADFVWLDVEEDSALVGEIDVENFPTLAVFRGGAPLFYGVTLPQEGIVARTLNSILEEKKTLTSVPKEVADLPGALASRLQHRHRG